MGHLKVDSSRAEALRRQIVVYSARAWIRVRNPTGLWVDWKDAISRQPLLIVRTASAEIVGSDRSGSVVFSGDEASMCHAQIGRLGLPIGKRDCLKIRVVDGPEYAVSPKGSIEDAWQSLAVAGVRID